MRLSYLYNEIPHSGKTSCYWDGVQLYYLHLFTNTESRYNKSVTSWWRHQIGNIFRVTGHLCGEFIGPRWIPHTKASDAALWCLLWSAAGWVNNREAGALRHNCAHYDVIVMYCASQLCTRSALWFCFVWFDPPLGYICMIARTMSLQPFELSPSNCVKNWLGQMESIQLGNKCDPTNDREIAHNRRCQTR